MSGVLPDLFSPIQVGACELPNRIDRVEYLARMLPILLSRAQTPRQDGQHE